MANAVDDNLGLSLRENKVNMVTDSGVTHWPQDSVLLSNG